MKKYLKIILNITIYIFATVGLFFTLGFFAVKFGLTNTGGIIDDQRRLFLSGVENTSLLYPNAPWLQSEEWSILKTAVTKDEAVIRDVSEKTGISTRMIFSVLSVEQLRLFFTERAIYKEILSPLKILGTQSQFSLGVMGIKLETAKKIEANLKDTTSPYYLGKDFENILDFKTSDIDRERYERLTNDKDREYAYLYAAVYIKEMISAWKRAKVDISLSPGIIATLYNIGFENSHPNPMPEIGGAEIDILNTKYSFGGLAHDVYYGDSLIDIFPR